MSMFTKIPHPKSCEYIKCEHRQNKVCMRSFERGGEGCDRGRLRLAYEDGLIPVSQGDHIRNMNDEELAEFLEGDYGNFETGKALDWLRQQKEQTP